MSYHEGLPRIVLESLYIGLYTLSNNLPGLRNIFDEYENGKLILENNLSEFYNEIIKYNDIPDLNVKSKYSREKVANNFSTDEIVNQFLEVYRKL